MRDAKNAHTASDLYIPESQQHAPDRTVPFSASATSTAAPKPTCDREVTERLGAPSGTRDFNRENRA